MRSHAFIGLGFALAVACSSSESSSPASADPDASPADARPITCCTLGPPSCDCPISGTNPDGTCRRGPCDAVPSETKLDERGCPYYSYSNARSCLGPDPTLEPARSDDRATGSACTNSADCDLTSRGIAACTTSLFGEGVGACFRNRCDPDAADAKCDLGAGTCVELGEATCLPRCTFGNDGAEPVGCLAGTTCSYRMREATTDVRGVGYCLGGCKDDSGCASGWNCQPEYGRCVKMLTTFTKTVGEACSGLECACLGSPGYCTTACRFDLDECGAGFTCDPQLPPEFTKAPRGLAGWCHKTCTTDADCTNAKCVATGGLSVKVCRPK